jgi:L-lactate permease
MMEVWPAILVTGLSFAIPQFLVSNFIGPEMVDIIAALISMGALMLFLRSGSPRRSGPRLRCASTTIPVDRAAVLPMSTAKLTSAQVWSALDAMDHPLRVRVHLGLPTGSRGSSTRSSPGIFQCLNCTT